MTTATTAKQTFWTFDQFATDLTVLGIATIEVRRPRTTRIAKGALYAVVVADATRAAAVEQLATDYNDCRKVNTGQARLQTKRQRVPQDNTGAIEVLVWGFKPVYR